MGKRTRKAECLRYIRAEDYCLSMKDMTVAAIIKAYLTELTEEAALEQMEMVLSPELRACFDEDVRNPGRPDEVKVIYNAEELAALIDKATAAAGISAMEWKANEGEEILKTVIDYIRKDVLPNLSGKNYVLGMPTEMEDFLLDCWHTLRRCLRNKY